MIPMITSGCFTLAYGGTGASNALVSGFCFFFPAVLATFFTLFFFGCCCFLVGIKLLYTVALVSAVQWSASAIGIHTSPPFWISILPPTHCI